MKKTLLLLLVFICNILILHAQKLHIDGKVSDSGKKPIENVTVYLLKAKDSSIVNYTASNKEGNFSLKIDALEEPSVLRIDAENLFYSKRFEKIDQSISLGDIVLEKKAIINIDEVKITVSPVKIKKDTIEFNASAIKVRPDSKIEELLKQIPGVEISNDDKITVNGKEVDQIMVNGKPFFDKDGKMALQNLPADIIKNIQFTTTKTKDEELSGKPPKSQNTTINFNIDEKKNKGLLSRITVGHGSDKRYEGSGLVSYFKGDTKISILASSNNINSKSISADEVFDNMGRSSKGSGTQGGGIQKSTTIGVNFNDKLSKDADLDNLSIKYSDSDRETHSKISKTTLLPDYTLKTTSENSSSNESKQYNFDSSVRIKLDSLTNIYISPSFSGSESFNYSQTRSSTLRDDKLLNESSSSGTTNSTNNTFSPNIYFSKNLKKKGRVISATVNSTISEAKSDQLNQSQNTFYQETGAVTTDNRNQIQKNQNQNDQYNFSAGYTEPLSDSVTVGMEIKYSSKLSRDSRAVNDFDPATGQYSKYNTELSNSMQQRINQFSPELSFSVFKKKFNIWTIANLDISDMKVLSVFKGQQYDLQKNFILPRYMMNFQYAFSDRKRITFSNSASFSIPAAEQLIPYHDESNPLISYTGNPNLKNSWMNSSSLSFNSYNLVKNFHYYITLGFTYRNNDVVNYSKYDNSGRQIITYGNISGNKTFNISTNFNKSFKWGDKKMTISPRFSLNYVYNNGFINGQLFRSNSYNISPALNFGFEIKDKLTIKPSYKIGYNFSKYSNYTVDQVNTTNQSLKLELTNYLFQSRLVFGNDFEYNTNSNIAPGFKRDFYFWNTSLGYSFFKKQLTAKIKVYDVLNQNQSVRRTIADSYFEDREDLILKRYIMFSLSMKLNKFSGKKPKKKQKQDMKF